MPDNIMIGLVNSLTHGADFNKLGKTMRPDNEPCDTYRVVRIFYSDNFFFFVICSLCSMDSPNLTFVR